MDFFGTDPIQDLTPDQLRSISAGFELGANPDDASRRDRASRRLQVEQRSFSSRPENVWKPLIGGEVVRAGVELGLKPGKMKSYLGKAGLALDAIGNIYGANSSTAAGEDPYGNVVMRNGQWGLETPEGINANSMATNTIEGLISAAQWTKVGAIPASLFAGELTEAQIHDANRKKAPRLAEIASTPGYGGSKAEMETLMRNLHDLRVASAASAPDEPGKISGMFWKGIRDDAKAMYDDKLAEIAADLSSGDEARILRASESLPAVAEMMDRVNADMEAVQTSSQEFTWPLKRFGEFVADEAPNMNMTHYFSGDRLLETLSGNVTSHGLLDYLRPSGKNMKQYQQRRAWSGQDRPTRSQGSALLRELANRGRAAAGGDTVLARDAKQKAINDNFSVADPGYGLYQ
jgi:hypothetical protein